MIEKTNLIAIGSCVIGDIIRCNPLLTQTYNVKTYTGSISRGMHPPGKISLRLEEEIQHSKKTSAEERQYRFVTKQPNIFDFVSNVPKNSVIILDYSYEVQNLFFDGDEVFDLGLLDVRYTSFPDWFVKIVESNRYSYDHGIQELAIFQYRNLKKFNKILDSLNVPIIFLDNLFTRKVYDPATKSIGTILPLYNNSVRFTKTKTMDSELDIFHYSQNMIDRFYQNGREDKGKNSYIFTYSHHENLFADLSHPWGYHPVHLHRICREAVSSELFKFIENSRLDFDKKNNTLII
jgi:hypothetical protein